MTISVSIVEDDTHTRDLLASTLEKANGFRCLSRHADAESAIALLPGLKPEVVLVDINLPGESGVECVRRLKPGMPETQFLMLTTYEDSNYIFEALAAGATGYLIKRTIAKGLLDAIREVKNGGSPMASNIARKVVQSFLSPPAAAATGEGLSSREKQVLELLAEGRLYKEIADALNIGSSTVCTYIRRIYEKLHVRSRAQAVAVYLKHPKSRDRDGLA